MTKDEIIKALRDMAKYPTVTLPRDCDALRAAADLLAQPVQEPVAWRFDQAKYRENDLRGRHWMFNCFSPTKPYMDEMVRNVTPLYTSPQPQKPLTDEQIWDAYMKAPVDFDCHITDLNTFARAIEAAHGIKE